MQAWAGALGVGGGVRLARLFPGAKNQQPQPLLSPQFPLPDGWRSRERELRTVFPDRCRDQGFLRPLITLGFFRDSGERLGPGYAHLQPSGRALRPHSPRLETTGFHHVPDPCISACPGHVPLGNDVPGERQASGQARLPAVPGEVSGHKEGGCCVSGPLQPP